MSDDIGWGTEEFSEDLANHALNDTIRSRQVKSGYQRILDQEVFGFFYYAITNWGTLSLGLRKGILTRLVEDMQHYFAWLIKERILTEDEYKGQIETLAATHSDVAVAKVKLELTLGERSLNRARSLLKAYVYLISILLEEHLKTKSNHKELKKEVNATKKRGKANESTTQET